jgi:hypothetical protein
MGHCTVASALDLPLKALPAREWATDRSDVWWTMWLPLALAAALIAIRAAAPDFYLTYVLPEGYGLLELGHFFIPLAGFILCVQMLRLDVVKRSRLLWYAIVFFAISSFYIAGEEHSWGQHFVNWNTPAYWAEINRQQETNLHNISPWFNQRPKLVFELALLIGGLIVPLVQRNTAPFKQPLLALLTPPAALIPTLLMALLFKGMDQIDKHVLPGAQLFLRPSEVVETFEYLFLLYYLIVLRRRVRVLEAAGVTEVML